jgi:hypothetical protein
VIAAEIFLRVGAAQTRLMLRGLDDAERMRANLDSPRMIVSEA